MEDEYADGRPHKRRRQGNQPGEIRYSHGRYEIMASDQEWLNNRLQARTNAALGLGSIAKRSLDVISLDEVGDGILVSHEELVCSIQTPPGGSSNFDVQQVLHINPGLRNVFPIVSRFAELYEVYRIRKCVFRARSRVDARNGVAQGTWGMMVNYNPDAQDPLNKREMQSGEYTVFGNIADSLLCGIECDPKERAISETLFVRTDKTPHVDSFATFDCGKLMIVTCNTPNVPANFPIGELWVTIEVELRRLVNKSEALEVGEGLNWTMLQNNVPAGGAPIQTWPNHITGLFGSDVARTVSIPLQYGLPLPGWYTPYVTFNQVNPGYPAVGDGYSVVAGYSSTADKIQIAAELQLNGDHEDVVMTFQLTAEPGSTHVLAIWLLVTADGPYVIKDPTVVSEGDASYVVTNKWAQLKPGDNQESNFVVFSWQFTVGQGGGPMQVACLCEGGGSGGYMCAGGVTWVRTS